jgi:antitoxin MazE
MTKAIKSRIVQVGNSQGIRIPKSMLEQSGIVEDIELEVRDNQIVITGTSKPRSGWGESFAQMVANGDELEILPVSNSWDETEWQW